MGNKKIEERIQDVIDNSVPDVWENILASCTKETSNLINMNKKEEMSEKNTMNKNTNANNSTESNGIKNSKSLKNKLSWNKYLSAASLLLLIGFWGVGVSAYRNSMKVNSTIMFDVNPSINMEVNKREKVLSVKANNEDGIAILGDMDLKKTDLDVAVNAIIGSMLQQGYISDIENSILISVENDDKEKGLSLQKRISSVVEGALNSSSIESAVYSQVLNKDTKLEIPNQDNLSLGKANLISTILKEDKTLTYEQLVGLDIHELTLLMEKRKIEDSQITHVGKVSEKKYLSKEQVEELVYTHSKVKKEEVRKIEIELDIENGLMVYEVEFETMDMEHEYDMNAMTGEIISSKVEKQEKQIEQENGNTKKNQDVTQNGNKNENINNSSSSSVIGKDKAEEIAISHAQLRVESIKKISSKYDEDDKEYDVEIHTARDEYDYNIDSISGKILDFDKELIDNDDFDDDKKEKKTDNKSSSIKEDATSKGSDNNGTGVVYLSKQKVKAIVASHAKVTENNMLDYEIKLDEDDGRMTYEVEFVTSNMEYEYVIDAITGKILDRDLDNISLANSTTSEIDDEDNDEDDDQN